MANRFELLMACIMVFYRDCFEDTRRYPVAYSSAAIVVWFGFLIIAGKGMLTRIGVFAPPRAAALTFQFGDVLFLTILLALYIALVFYYTREHRWKRVVAEFDQLPYASKLSVRVLSLVAFVGVSLWAMLELFVLGK